MIELFGNLESGNVHKVQLILARLGAAYTRVDVFQTKEHARTPEYLRLNPMGKFPAVRLDSGEVLTESGAILYWFSQGTELWPQSVREQTEVLRWMFFEQYSHEPALAVLRYWCAFESAKVESRVEELSRASRRALSTMEAHLEQREWIAATGISIADYALYPYTKWAPEAGIDLAPYPAVRAWLARVEHEPHFLPLRADGAQSTQTFEQYFLQPGLIDGP